MALEKFLRPFADNNLSVIRDTFIMKKAILFLSFIVCACAVMPLSAVTKNQDAVFTEIAVRVSALKNKLKKGTVAVFPFEAHGFAEAAYGTWAADKISAALSERGKLRLVEREKLTRLMKEKELSMSGIVEQREARRIGSLLSVDAVVMGRLYFNYAPMGEKKGARLDAMKPRYRCVAERRR